MKLSILVFAVLSIIGCTYVSVVRCQETVSQRLTEVEKDVKILRTAFVVLLKQMSQNTAKISAQATQNAKFAGQISSLARSVRRNTLRRNKIIRLFQAIEASRFQQYVADLRKWSVNPSDVNITTNITDLLGNGHGHVNAKLDQHDDDIDEIKAQVQTILERLENLTKAVWSYGMEQATQEVETTSMTTTAEPSGPCTDVDSFTNYVTLPSVLQDYTGMFAKDPLSDNDKTYFLAGYTNSKTLLEFDSEADFLANKNPTTHTLPVACEGAQSVVVGGHLYCNEQNTANILVYDLNDVKSVVRIPLVNINGSTAAFHNTCPYGYGGFSDIDLEFDGNSLYAIWGRESENCNIAISRINRSTNTVEKTWFPRNFRRRSGGNAIMACGKLYAFGNFRGETTITFTFDTATEQVQRNTQIAYTNRHGYTRHLHYDSREKKLFVWDDRHTMKVDVVFKEQ